MRLLSFFRCYRDAGNISLTMNRQAAFRHKEIGADGRNGFAGASQRRTIMTKYFTIGIDLAIMAFIVGTMLSAGHI